MARTMDINEGKGTSGPNGIVRSTVTTKKPAQSQRKPGGIPPQFPKSLHLMLSRAEEDGYSDIVSWNENGDAFCVKDREKFVDDVMPLYFQQTKFSSFQRQLNIYGFQRADEKGAASTSYRNKYFQRDQPELTDSIARVAVKAAVTTGSEKSPEHLQSSKLSAFAVPGQAPPYGQTSYNTLEGILSPSSGFSPHPASSFVAHGMQCFPMQPPFPQAPAMAQHQQHDQQYPQYYNMHASGSISGHSSHSAPEPPRSSSAFAQVQWMSDSRLQQPNHHMYGETLPPVEPTPLAPSVHSQQHRRMPVEDLARSTEDLLKALPLAEETANNSSASQLDHPSVGTLGTFDLGDSAKYMDVDESTGFDDDDDEQMRYR